MLCNVPGPAYLENNKPLTYLTVKRTVSTRGPGVLFRSGDIIPGLVSYVSRGHPFSPAQHPFRARPQKLFIVPCRRPDERITAHGSRHTACCMIPATPQYPVAKQKQTRKCRLQSHGEQLSSESDHGCPQRDAKTSAVTPSHRTPTSHRLEQTCMSTPIRQLIKILDDGIGLRRGPSQRNEDWIRVTGVALLSSKSVGISHGDG